MFYGCFSFGQHLVDAFRFVDQLFWPIQQQESAENFVAAELPTPSVLQPLNVFICIASSILWVTYGLLFIFVSKSRSWTGPMFFAPVGAGIRWYSSHWNVHWPRLKMATLCVNVIGSIIYSVLIVCKWKYTPTNAAHPILYSFLTSLISGFCGTVTTVSTFIYELHSMKHARYSYFYAIVSVLGAQAASLIILSVAHFGFNVPFS